MKRHEIQLLILVISLPGYLRSQSNEHFKKKEIVPLLCYTWNITSRLDSSVKFIEPAESPSTFQFLQNGTVILTSDSPVAGSWNYNKRNHLLAIILKGQMQNFKILRITGTEMVLRQTSAEGKTAYYWRDN
ncbi:MAG TPA: hypothetical protein VGI82_12280 [Chitinophagaceae bacterium]